MAWSTRELADIAGTTIKAVRHYHKLGLLDDPERQSNGYKQYQVSHLVRLLQITRLADLGVSLAQIANMDRADQDPSAALRGLDAELAATVDRLQRIRGELAVILAQQTPTDLPAGFGAAGNDLSDADRSLIMVYSRVVDEAAMQDMREIVSTAPRTDADAEFDALPATADRATRSSLAAALAPAIGAVTQKYDSLQDPGSRAPRGAAFAESTMTQALHELYNPAQLEVLYRAHLISVGSTEQLDALEAALDAADHAALDAADTNHTRK